MKKKNHKVYEEFVLDTTITYSMPMVKNGIKPHVENESVVDGVFARQSNNGDITFYKEGYQSKYVTNKYAEWLIYSGYIRKE